MNWALPAADTYFAPILAADPRGFQIDHLELALKHCTRFRTAVDGGAHIGTWSAQLAGRFDHVMAFEPAADTFDCLKANVQESSNVFPFRFALGTRRGRGKIVDDESRKGNTGSRYLIEGDGVEVVPLDYFCINDLDFLKLDVEGSELPALQGAINTILHCKPVIVIEVKRLRAGHDPHAAVLWLTMQGYSERASAGNDRVFVFGE